MQGVGIIKQRGCRPIVTRDAGFSQRVTALLYVKCQKSTVSTLFGNFLILQLFSGSTNKNSYLLVQKFTNTVLIPELLLSTGKINFDNSALCLVIIGMSVLFAISPAFFQKNV